MTLRLDRLQSTLRLVDNEGRPTTQFQMFWQKVMQEIERADAEQQAIIDELAVQQGLIAENVAEINRVLGIAEDALAASRLMLVGSTAISIEAATDATPVAGQLPKSSRYYLFLAGVDRSADATWAVAVKSGAATVSIAAGVLSISGMTTNAAAVDISATLDGELRKMQATISKRIAQPNINVGGGGGTAQTDNSFEAVTTASLAPISDELIVKAGTAGEVNLTAPLEFNATGGGVGIYDAAAQWQRWDGAAWVALGSEQASTLSCVEDESGFRTPGQITVNHVDAGLTPATEYKFGLWARQSAATAATYIFTGTAAGEGR